MLLLGIPLYFVGVSVFQNLQGPGLVPVSASRHPSCPTVHLESINAPSTALGPMAGNVPLPGVSLVPLQEVEGLGASAQHFLNEFNTPTSTNCIVTAGHYITSPLPSNTS